MTDGSSGDWPPSLGSKGGGWVLLQAALLLIIGVAGLLGTPWPPGARTPLLVAAGAVGVGGSALALAGVRGLGRSLTPYPRPLDHGTLTRDGVYGLVRHPIYGGVLCLCLAWSLATAPVALIPSALLVVVFEGKRRREEAWLRERYPDYAEYVRAVPRRFLPFVW